METRIRVAALIMDGDRVLLVSTKQGQPGYLVPPGGGLEPPEALAEAVVREAHEESGLHLACGALAGYREVARADRFELELYFATRLLQSPSSVSDISEENRQVRWVELSALPHTPHFPEELGEMCRRLAENHLEPLYLGRSEI